MEHQAKVHGETEDEKFPDGFMCCVCLEILYKPVVLVCGHISCFWCVFKTMHSSQESHCPACRNAYSHFPRVCELLHFLILRLYPRAYRRREKQVREEEKKYGRESPQFHYNFLDSQFNKVADVQDISSPLIGAVPSEPTCGGNDSYVQDSSPRISHEDNTTAPTTSSSQTTTNDTNSMFEHANKILLTDLQCVCDLQCDVCKQLLCHPVVLNCGHVFCEACIVLLDLVYEDCTVLRGRVCKCPVCQSAHPIGFPNVCLVLKHFLEEHFPKEYSARNQGGSPS